MKGCIHLPHKIFNGGVWFFFYHSLSLGLSVKGCISLPLDLIPQSSSVSLSHDRSHHHIILTIYHSTRVYSQLNIVSWHPTSNHSIKYNTIDHGGKTAQDIASFNSYHKPILYRTSMPFLESGINMGHMIFPPFSRFSYLLQCVCHSVLGFYLPQSLCQN